jgi:hypothetical protein
VLPRKHWDLNKKNQDFSHLKIWDKDLPGGHSWDMDNEK